MTGSLAREIDDLAATDREIVGGKGANLGELRRAGFPVPDAFVLTTEAYLLAARATDVDASDPASAAERLRAAPVAEPVARAAVEAYAALGGGAVAVRSSATAEDLPGASFAGQQDTYLSVVGEGALVDAVRRCWASLWNERAVAYRRANGIDDALVALAVVVQRMVDASAAGVLFTADPLTGRRRRATIDAVAGLGEKLVSGAVSPDHYLVDTASSAVVERRPVGDRPVLSDDQLRALATLGDRVERYFGAPQDIEFAFDQARRLWLVQSRPITTLYPLPAGAPDPGRDLRVYFSGNVFQGYFAPITTMGMEPFRTIGEKAASLFADAAAPGRPGAPPVVVEAGMRVYVDVTAVLRDALGGALLTTFSAIGEARSSVLFRALRSDPRLTPRSRSRLPTLWRLLRIVVRSGMARSVLRSLRSPNAARDGYVAEIEEAARIDLPPDATAEMRVDLVERRLRSLPPLMFPRLVGPIPAGMLSYLAVRRLLGDLVRDDEMQTLTRGVPHNPTTEMDLALWSLAKALREDPPSSRALLERGAGDLTAAYRAGALPRALQEGLAAFLGRYGFRCVGEIDLGVPRWTEDPTHLFGALANYMRLGDDALAPDAHFERGRSEAEAMVRSLLSRVHGPRRLLVRFFLRRVRALMGLREAPKYHLIRLLFTPTRDLLRPVGEELARSGRLTAPDDVYFLTLAEARRAVGGDDLRPIAAARRATYAAERARRHIPRVLLSDGTDAEAAYAPAREGGLRGSPASPGVATGPARVVLSPERARLEPGEILVAPSTDPGWTPLFLTAGGLVMEMGGMMSHGAVVAREYGIPAVVGVAGATERIRSGQRVTVDGSAGAVALET